jgi:mono/diheme cytochrome c family protein
LISRPAIWNRARAPSAPENILPWPKNEKLEASGYPVYLVIHGQNAMPPLGGMLDDEQIAAVADYIRTHFGNNYTDPVTMDDVKSSK